MTNPSHLSLSIGIDPGIQDTLNTILELLEMVATKDDLDAGIDKLLASVTDETSRVKDAIASMQAKIDAGATAADFTEEVNKLKTATSNLDSVLPTPAPSTPPDSTTDSTPATPPATPSPAASGSAPAASVTPAIPTPGIPTPPATPAANTVPPPIPTLNS
jgi:hypothetical protein